MASSGPALLAPVFPQFGFAVLAFASGLFINATALRAETVTLDFQPPQIEPQAICVTRAPDAVIMARWTDWDGQSLKGRDAAEVESDLRRLMELDAAGWYDKALKAIDLMPGINPDFDSAKQAMARIDLMVAAGKQSELTNLRLVPELLAMDATQSPRLQKAEANLLMRGIGIPADPERGMGLLVQAAYGGNADAILELVTMQLAGRSVPNWEVAPDMGVTMAFGALVGQLDPQICDRVTRIAREYKNGDVVTADLALSEHWYRFAADLGDLNAAWKVAEFHLRSEAVVKDNAVLLKYLQMAADGGNGTALVNLGRIYEIGALVPQDLTKAEALFAKAAAGGDRGGLIRNALFLQGKVKRDEAARAAYGSALDAVVALPDAPVWALNAAADEVIRAKGRWAGETQAMNYLDRAAALGDGLALRRLADMKMRYAQTDAAFYPLVDDLIASVQILGKIEPMTDLRAAFTCRAPEAPVIQEAEYWKGVEQATGNETVAYGPEDLLALARANDPLALARLQSQALSGRATAVAQYLTLIEKGDFSVVQQAFWEDYAKQFPNVLQSRGRLALSLARTEEERTEALTLFRTAVARGETEAGLYLAKALLTDGAITEADQAEATALLLPLANLGYGAAMSLLPLAAPDDFPDQAAVYAAFAETITARGDFEALLLAMEHVGDPALRQDYRARAIAMTSCNFDEVSRLAEVMGKMGDAEGFVHWAGITSYLAENQGWRVTRLADLYSTYGSAADKPKAEALYRVGYAAGNRTAMLRLLSTYARDDNPQYDPRFAAELYIALVTATKAGDLPELLTRIESEEPVIRKTVLAAIDPAQIYKVAAEAGDPVAMREYALRLREEHGDAAQATALLAKAADKGDVEAMVEYAISLAFGVGVAPSRDEALIWLDKAADLGNPRALTLVATLNLSESETQ